MIDYWDEEYEIRYTAAKELELSGEFEAAELVLKAYAEAQKQATTPFDRSYEEKDLSVWDSLLIIAFMVTFVFFCLIMGSIVFQHIRF